MLLLIIFLFFLGLAALVKGADLVVAFSAPTAARWGVPLAVIGLSIVSLGTILPELSIGIMAAARGANDIIVGNALGTFVFNLGVIFGIAALRNPMPVKGSILRHEFPWLALAAALVYFLSYDLVISRPDAVLLIILAIVFIWYSVRAGREHHQWQAEAHIRHFLPEYHSARRAWVKLLIGLALVVIGAKLFVGAAVDLAEYLHLSEFLVGVIIVAIGTSLPELATTYLASARRQASLGIGNIIGASSMNVFLVLGAAALINPIKIHPDLLIFDFPALIFFAVITSLFFKSHHRLSRVEGAALLALYGGYFIYGLKFWG